jgi:hypothetical protein
MAARLAQKGKGQKVRFQGGKLFPLIVALVCVLGSALVVYSRQSRPAADASAPTINDHWHHSYGFFLCDTWVQLDGDGEAQDASGRPTNVVGRRATLGVFTGVYGVEMSNDVLQFPEDQRAQLPEQFREDGRFESGESTCTIDGEEETGRLQVTRWDNISDTGAGTTFIAGFEGIPLNQDAMVVSIAFVPDDTDVGKPPWTEDFDENVLNDSNQRSADQLFPGATVGEDGDITDIDISDVLTDLENDEPSTSEV